MGDQVPDGFYTAIKELKMKNEHKINNPVQFRDFCNDYENILKLCRESNPIKPVTESESLAILKRMKKDISDVYSITPQHYLNAGPDGCRHFFLLLSSLLNDVSSTSIEEINASYAIVLFKGHSKDKSSSRSYRTISTCPVIAKGLDLYIRD